MKNSPTVKFLYGTAFGRGILKVIMVCRTDKIAVAFLRSRLSKPIISRYVKKNGIAITKEKRKKFKSFGQFFLRGKDNINVDMQKSHLISPCDGYLSAFPVDEKSVFDIKGSKYALADLFHDEKLANKFVGGDCLIFRLCASDYHHYIYIDNAKVGKNNYIEGKLYSVQPIALEHYKVFTQNRRSWTTLDTENFGKVVQTEVGAFIVGGIVNRHENQKVNKGDEKGNFDLCGSTIVLFFEKDKIELLDFIKENTKNGEEFRVEIGMYIGDSVQNKENPKNTQSICA